MANNESPHVALPKLYGAPAYARPPRHLLDESPKPFDPDDLPIAAEQTEEEAALFQELAPRAYSGAFGAPVSGAAPESASSDAGLRPRRFRLGVLPGIRRAPGVDEPE